MSCTQFIGNLEGLNAGQDYHKDLLKRPARTPPLPGPLSSRRMEDSNCDGVLEAGRRGQDPR
ncbi:hypothetical protein EYF80_065699 [Liparis tanakae]|uniref:Uncharacterized protein n=1 Tax=Liparis tanakae TaxID=230148 RepID=A0A4Z2E615_9TELE|nr:hypothetical protein EYF80_065699 [Liparis tanakae]